MPSIIHPIIRPVNEPIDFEHLPGHSSPALSPTPIIRARSETPSAHSRDGTDSVRTIFAGPAPTGRDLANSAPPGLSTPTPASWSNSARQGSSFNQSFLLATQGEPLAAVDARMNYASLGSDMTPPQHTRPLYASIPLPPVEGVLQTDVSGIVVADELPAAELVFSSASEVLQPGNPNLNQPIPSANAWASAQDELWIGGEGGFQANVLGIEIAVNVMQSFEESLVRGALPHGYELVFHAPSSYVQRYAPSHPSASAISTPALEYLFYPAPPILNVIQLYGALHPSPDINWPAILRERSAPATVPPTTYLTLMVSASGQIVSVPAPHGMVTVGDLLDALLSAFGGYLTGCESCAGVCVCVRLGVVLDALEVWEARMRV
ncbi:hypothetical protein D9615_006868 [Tricholomella constricta]|uniref:Uncharacterized protein n=1 Tax=Tricholomella constricta TaxID=117010 RepID=A0A8H5H8U7_9AGAR|nr:hypothetical protein D9615_006868 [Tricholomella constricta]